MKRLTSLRAEVERCRSLNLVDMCRHGFWECRRCQRVCVPVQERCDFADVSRHFYVCGVCGSHRVVHREAVFPD